MRAPQCSSAASCVSLDVVAGGNTSATISASVPIAAVRSASSLECQTIQASTVTSARPDSPATYIPRYSRFIHLSVLSFILRFGEHITCAAHGDNAARMLRVIFDCGPNAGDMYVDGSIEGFKRLTLDQTHQLITR